MEQSQGKPCRYRPAALSDLEDIWSFTAQRWSPDQADAYVTDLAAAIDRLSANPGIVRERIEFTPTVRIYNFKAHIVIFRDEGDHLDIIRIRHEREDWTSDLSDAG